MRPGHDLDGLLRAAALGGADVDRFVCPARDVEALLGSGLVEHVGVGSWQQEFALQVMTWCGVRR